MKLLTFKRDGENHLGIVTEQGVLDVFASMTALETQLNGLDLPSSIDAFLAGGLRYLPELKALQTLAQQTPGSWWLIEAELEIAPVIPQPGKVLCVGLNYRRHAAEAGMNVPSTPVLFSKFNNAIAATGETVPLPPEATQCDYEAELLVVIGKAASRVDEATALDYVLGYSNSNDISARDLQLLTGQWLLGKTLDKFLPIGPYLVTTDEIPDPQTLAIKTWYNGELRQNSNTQDMVFTVAQIISYVSCYFALQPGDIIATGTPEGVIFGDENPQWLKVGDTVVVEIDQLGRLENRMG
jgi:2-keto-4-pentenoate hydratase/2-oxohepta-3-ene-1,7-dioic acid hydratase in catechol pathway